MGHFQRPWRITYAFKNNKLFRIEDCPHNPTPLPHTPSLVAWKEKIIIFIFIYMVNWGDPYWEHSVSLLYVVFVVVLIYCFSENIFQLGITHNRLYNTQLAMHYISKNTIFKITPPLTCCYMWTYYIRETSASQPTVKTFL